MKLSISFSDVSLTKEEREVLPKLIPEQEFSSIPSKDKKFRVKTESGRSITVKTESRIPTYKNSRSGARAATGIRLVVIPTRKK